MNVLFVCYGNISRSFLAEVLLLHEARRTGLEDLNILSAGLFAVNGNPPDPEMVSYLKGLGLPVSAHAARQLSESDVHWADMILVMEKAHGQTIQDAWPESARKVHHLGRYVAETPYPDDIIDPYGKSPYHYRLAQAQISAAVTSLLKTIARTPQSP